MKTLAALVLAATLLLILAACQAEEPGCPPQSGTSVRSPAAALGPVPMSIGGNSVSVDRVVEGPLCDDTWRGTVYVGCAVQVKPWEGWPTFLKDCNLTIEPGTVVYVAYHHNAAYYNGCSCHTGQTAAP